MKKILYLPFIAAFMFVSCNPNKASSTEEQEHDHHKGDAVSKIKIKNLLRDSLELTEGIEVILTYVELPKETQLPTHYHPGEEFAYILEGSGELKLKDKSSVIIKAGEAGKVPLKHVHSFSSLNEDVKLVVFRVHEKGQPDRVLVE